MCNCYGTPHFYQLAIGIYLESGGYGYLKLFYNEWNFISNGFLTSVAIPPPTYAENCLVSPIVKLVGDFTVILAYIPLSYTIP